MGIMDIKYLIRIIFMCNLNKRYQSYHEFPKISWFVDILIPNFDIIYLIF